MYGFKGVVSTISETQYVGEKKYPKKEILVKQIEGKYPVEAMFTVFGENPCNQVSMVSVGDKVEVTFTVKSKEWKGRYFTELTLVAIKAEGKQSYSEAIQGKKETEKSFTASIEDDINDSVLPF